MKDLYTCCTCHFPLPGFCSPRFMMSFDEQQLLLVTWSYLSIFCLPICLDFLRSSSSPRHHNSILLGIIQKVSWCLSFFFFLILFYLTLPHCIGFAIYQKWICHRYTCVPHPEPSSLLPPRTIPLSRPSAPAPSIQYRASNLDWRLISYMILYIFQCHSPKSSHPLPLPQSP